VPLQRDFHDWIGLDRQLLAILRLVIRQWQHRPLTAPASHVVARDAEQPGQDTRATKPVPGRIFDHRDEHVLHDIVRNRA
jgi:hypothetical protein